MKNVKSILFTALAMTLFLVFMSLMYWGQKVTSIDFPAIILTVMLGYQAVRFGEWMDEKFNK